MHAYLFTAMLYVCFFKYFVYRGRNLTPWNYWRQR